MTGALPLAALGARPLAGWALLLPLVFLLLLRLLARPPKVVIGTLELWDGEPRAAPRGARARASFPPWALVAALALFLGALAWLGPRPTEVEAARRWTLVVDLSPSMQLASGAGTRLDAALASAREWLARQARPGDRVRWLAPQRGELELGTAEAPAPTWFRPRAEGEPEPEWELHDLAGALWITDRAPAVARARAGLFASGGAAVEGPIAADGHETVLWERGELRVVATETRPALLVRVAPGLALPAVLERVLVAWSEARGFELARTPRAGTRLVFELAARDGDASLELARDGWSATGRGGLTDAGTAELDAQDWLVGTDSRGTSQVLVRARRGSVQVGLSALSEPRGDPAQFALSWSRLLDRSLLAAEGVVALGERRAAGEARAVAGESPAEGSADSAQIGPRIDAGLALAAGVCALLALGLRPRA